MPQYRYEVRLDFEAVKLPPVTDILVLGSRYTHGKLGIFESFRFLVPDQYDFYDVDNPKHPNIGSVVVSKQVVRRLAYPQVEKVLAEHVFPFLDESEAVNVNFTVRRFTEGIEL